MSKKKKEGKESETFEKIMPKKFWKTKEKLKPTESKERAQRITNKHIHTHQTQVHTHNSHIDTMIFDEKQNKF